MQIVSNADNLHEMSNPASGKIKMPSTENFTQNAKR